MPQAPSYDAVVAALRAQAPGTAPATGLDDVLRQLVEAVAAAAEPDLGALKLTSRHLAHLLASRYRSEASRCASRRTPARGRPSCRL